MPALPPLIPRRTFFANPDRAAVQVSPDGRHLSWLAPREGVLNVWLAPLESPESARAVTDDRGRGIRDHAWAQTGEHVLYLQDANGDENWHVHAVDLASGQERDLTPLPGVAAHLEASSDLLPEQVLVRLNDRDARFHDIHRIDVRTGERELVLRNDGFAGFACDRQLRVRLAARFREDGGIDYLLRAGEGWEPFLEVGLEDSLTTRPLAFDRDGERLFGLDSRGRDTSALVAWKLDSPEPEVLAQHERADACAVLLHPVTRVPQAVAFDHLRREWQVLDPEIEGDLAELRAVAPGELEVTGRTLADDVWTVAHVMDDGPVRYHVHDRRAGSQRFLFTGREALEDLELATMSPVVVTARDDLELVSYLSLPPGAAVGGEPRPEEPLPAVLLVHGGPWQRDSWGYNPLHQLLANRGYAVLSVNFRGSTGFGKSFLNAAAREWGRRMHDDLVDAVEWMAAEGIARRERVAIMGGSYGGYATLVGLTMTPDVFACGVDIVGPSSLVTLMESLPPYWKPQQEIWRKRVGDPDTEEGRAFLLERSPLTHVESIRRPLLIGQGANDPRVKQSESDQIVAAMREKGIPVTYALFPDEGHGFARPENNLAFFAMTDAFLGRHLGGRSGSLSRDDFAGSSLKVPVGVEEIPGLAECLEE